MPYYRKKPVVVEAREYNGLNYKQLIEWMVDHDVRAHTRNFASPPSIYISTLEGVMEAQPGDFIIKGVAGEFYPCKRSIFTDTYDRIEEATHE